MPIGRKGRSRRTVGRNPNLAVQKSKMKVFFIEETLLYLLVDIQRSSKQESITSSMNFGSFE